MMRLFATLLLVSAAMPAWARQPQPHNLRCPGDVVVWMNPASGNYHFNNEQYFGTTNMGHYECRRTADGEGGRPDAGQP